MLSFSKANDSYHRETCPFDCLLSVAWVLCQIDVASVQLNTAVAPKSLVLDI